MSMLGHGTGSVVLGLTLALTGCGGETPEAESEAPAASTAESSPAESPSASAKPDDSASPDATGTTITTGPSDYGTMLFDANDQAIYIWEVEGTSEPECYGDCARAWPPVLTDGAPVADGDVRLGLLGTARRRDGAVQVTYNGHPLYFYAHEGPGEVECHDIVTHGGTWWVVQPDGDRAA
jgi:predicted lipoprotein with Yx(FWY)xxD motif